MKFIQVGVGGFGRTWLKCLVENKKARLAGIVDPNPEAIDIACEKWSLDKGIAFPSLKKAIAGTGAEAVVCVTPPKHHKAAIIEAMRAGLHVITEKPMADTQANCAAIVRAAEETGMTCAVSQNYRFAPPTWTMAEIIRKGKIGEIGQANIDFYKGFDFKGGFRHVMDYPVIIDMSIHHFDLIRFITGLNPVSVRGEAWNPKWSNYKGDCSSSLVFTMENGARIVYNASWCAKGDYCDWNGNWQIEGSKGALIYRGAITLNSAPSLYAVKKSEQVPMTNPKYLAQNFVLEDFMRAVKTGRRPATDVFDNIKSVSMVFAAVKAVKTGRTVKIQ